MKYSPQKRTFTRSEEALSALQERYGTTDYSEWQSLRREWYSYVNYPTAGASETLFFSDVAGQAGVTTQSTNMPKANSFGQTHFLLKQIKMDIRIADWMYNLPVANDLDTLYSDIINGFVQDGVLEILISGRVYAQIPRPFLLAPPADGRPCVRSAGLEGLTLATGTPDTFTSAVTHPPYASLSGGKLNSYIMDPNILIEAEQAFTCRLRYGTAVPIIATDVEDATTNPLSVGCIFSGIGFRPIT